VGYVGERARWRASRDICKGSLIAVSWDDPVGQHEVGARIEGASKSASNGGSQRKVGTGKTKIRSRDECGKQIGDGERHCKWPTLRNPMKRVNDISAARCGQ
jgi:hypothetical protein